MSKQAAEHHKQAAEHLEQAAKQHLEAAKQHVEGGFEKAAHHAQLAHAHHVEAIQHARNAAKEHLKAHGKKQSCKRCPGGRGAQERPDQLDADQGDLVPNAKRRRRPDTGNMAINGSDWHERHHVWWTDKAEDAQFPDTEYRMKIMENGMLLFQHEELGANYVCAPHTWRRVRTLGVDPME